MEISIGMTRAAYVRYVMSEGRIEAAIANGTEELEIRHWCEESLPSVMDDAPEDVLFDAYLAVARTRIT